VKRRRSEVDTDLYNLWTLPLVRRYGVGPVYDTGIHILGYPPTWQLSLREADVLRAALKGRFPDA
jgi:hypothetical protein